MTPIDPRLLEMEILSAAERVAWSGTGAGYQYVRANPASPADLLRDEALLELLFQGALVSASPYQARDNYNKIPDPRPPNPSHGIDAAALKAITEWLTENRPSVNLRITQRGRLRLYRLRDEMLSRDRIRDEFNVLWAHRHWLPDLEVRLRFREPGTAISLLLLDVDRLKLLNSELGNPGADKVLTGIFEELRDAVRPHEGYRLGGDEAGAILVGVSLDYAKNTAEEIRRRVESRVWPADLNIKTRPTVSIGVGTSTVEIDAEAFYKAVDRVRARAKESRNLVVAEPVSGAQ